MARGKQKKDKFEALETEWRDAVMGEGEDGIKKRIANTALEVEELLKAKEADQDLYEKGLAYKEAGAIYRDGTKMGRLRIQFCKQVLESRGK